MRQRGEELLALIERRRERRGQRSRRDASAASPDPQQLALVTKLMNVARDTGGDMRRSAPELLATRRDIEQLVFSGAPEHLLSGWRREVIGEPLLAARRASQR